MESTSTEADDHEDGDNNVTIVTDANNNSAAKPVKLQNPPALHRSAVWKHFSFKIVTVNGRQVMERERSVYKICFSEVSYKAGNTTKWPCT